MFQTCFDVGNTLLTQRNHVGTLFNKGKAVSMMGKAKEGQEVYREAWGIADGPAASVWLKICAALKQTSDSELAIMEDRASLVESKAQKGHVHQSTSTEVSMRVMVKERVSVFPVI